jgi:hypothetical protein
MGGSMGRRSPRESSLEQYRRYVRWFEEARRPEPEAWLDGLTPHSAKVGRAALRWAYPNVELRWREVREKSREQHPVRSLGIEIRSGCGRDRTRER